jgi:O-antigen/teichoic acid export membrane protein
MFKVGIYMSVFFGGLLAMLSRPFIERWVGAGYEDANVVIWIFLIPSVFGMMMSVSNQLLYGISKHKFLTWINCGEALINLTLSLIFVRFWGIYGVALGTAIPACIVRIFIQPVYTAKVLNAPVRRIYGVMLSATAKSVLVLAALYAVTQGLIAVSFLRLIAFGAINTACYAGVMFKMGLTGPEQEQLLMAFTLKK